MGRDQQPEVRRAGQLRAAVHRRAGARVVRRDRRPRDLHRRPADLARDAAGGPGEQPEAQRHARLLPDVVLPAAARVVRRGVDLHGLHLRHQVRAHQLLPERDRAPRGALAQRPVLGEGHSRTGGGLATGRLHVRPVRRRPDVRPRRRAGGRGDRRRRTVAHALPHQDPADQPDDPVRHRDRDDQRDAAVRPALHHDEGRAGHRDDDRDDLPLPGGLPEPAVRVRLRHRDPAARHHRHHHRIQFIAARKLVFYQ